MRVGRVGNVGVTSALLITHYSKLESSIEAGFEGNRIASVTGIRGLALIRPVKIGGTTEHIVQRPGP